MLNSHTTSYFGSKPSNEGKPRNTDPPKRMHDTFAYKYSRILVLPDAAWGSLKD